METERVFTPRLTSTDAARLTMKLSDGDYVKIGRGGPWRAVVTDQNTGKQYRVRGASCGLPRCFCDAVILAEVK